MQKHCLKKAR